MGSIPKIVSTPLKWVSKRFLNRTLLRFPGGDAHDPVVCTYCPEMCRFSCPVAVVSGNDALTPCNKMGFLYKERTWPARVSQGEPLWPIYACTGCGRCTNYCVYEVPVADQLFAARAENPWSHAAEVAQVISDSEDPIGDLADELGDFASAKRRLEKFQSQSTSGFSVEEPRSLFFLKENDISAKLSWLRRMEHDPPDVLVATLRGKKWLFHESVWWNRRLGMLNETENWARKLSATGIELIYPFECGKDCIDCGGEGVYSRIFSDQAQEMAKSIWERDRHRAQGIVCLSARCANHFRVVLGKGVPVISFAEVLR